MKQIYPLLILAVFVPTLAFGQDWSNVSLIDTQCSMKVKANPDAHTRSCAMACAKSGFGILDKQGHYLKFDQKGNQQALKLLENSSKQDHLRVDVSGKAEGEVIHVDSLKLL